MTDIGKPVSHLPQQTKIDPFLREAHKSAPQIDGIQKQPFFHTRFSNQCQPTWRHLSDPLGTLLAAGGHKPFIKCDENVLREKINGFSCLVNNEYSVIYIPSMCILKPDSQRTPTTWPSVSKRLRNSHIFHRLVGAACLFFLGTIPTSTHIFGTPIS